MKERYWISANGKRRKFSKIGHQHLSNILWYKEIFNNVSCDGVYRELNKQIHLRFNGIRLKWKPLPISNEIDSLYEMGLINNYGYIVYHNEIIGSIKHIKDLI